MLVDVVVLVVDGSSVVVEVVANPSNDVGHGVPAEVHPSGISKQTIGNPGNLSGIDEEQSFVPGGHVKIDVPCGPSGPVGPTGPAGPTPHATIS